MMALWARYRYIPFYFNALRSSNLLDTTTVVDTPGIAYSIRYIVVDLRSMYFLFACFLSTLVYNRANVAEFFCDGFVLFRSVFGSLTACIIVSYEVLWRPGFLLRLQGEVALQEEYLSVTLLSCLQYQSLFEDWSQKAEGFRKTIIES